MNIPLSIILGGVSERRGVTLFCPHRVCPTDTSWWDSRIQGVPVPFGAVWSFETATAQGLKPNRTTSRVAGKRRCRHWLEPRLSLDHCKPAAHTRIGIERDTALRRMGDVCNSSPGIDMSAEVHAAWASRKALGKSIRRKRTAGHMALRPRAVRR
jgi:hypothetical protein